MRGKPLVIAMCFGQVGGLLPHMVVPAVMSAHLIPLWGLTNAQAGLMAAAYGIGYMIAVPFLTALTDRYDGRLVLLLGSLFSALATWGFGLLADGLASACVLWCLAGVGFAGAYMPGLRALIDRLDGLEASRSVTLYTSSFSLGVGLSFLVSQLVADRLGWRASFLLTGLGPLVMAAVAWSMPPVRPPPPTTHLLDFRPAFGNRVAMGYILSYGAHCFELYGLRTWIVAFWTFVALRHGGNAVPSPMMVSFIVAVLAMPASIFGNELALRFGRHRAITAIQFASAAVALSIGALASASPWILLPLVLIYAITVPADSGSLTAGTSAAADPRFRGITLALHSTVGFGLAGAAGWVVGVALDHYGGTQQPEAWMAGFAVLAAGVLCGPLVLWWSRSRG